MSTFGTMTARIASELRRSNILPAIKGAVNDAIAEAAKTRFWFNESENTTFLTAANQPMYPDLGFTEVDDIYLIEANGARRYMNRKDAEDRRQLLDGFPQTGIPDIYFIRGETIRLYPVPSQIWTIGVDGFGKLAPWPLVADVDTNAWMTHGERMIRAWAKSIVMKDTVRDFGEATVYEAIAMDYKDSLIEDTTLRLSTGTRRAYRM